MNLLSRLYLTGVLAGCVFLSLSVQAQNAAPQLTDQQRISRLERLLSADKQRQQIQTINALKEDIASLHEQIEQMTNQLENLKQRQRSLYQDVDRRVNNIELRGGSASAPVPPPSSVSANRAGAAVTAGTGDMDGKDAYAVAFGLLKEGKYQQSITAFEKFLGKYPQSKYADNASYWLGEANYVSRKYKKSLSNFEQLIAQFPQSTKIPGARLKIGYVYFELKNWSAAREALQHVIKLYPGTTVAKKAGERLQRMKREGH